jgi:hypothetical protein
MEQAYPLFRGAPLQWNTQQVEMASSTENLPVVLAKLQDGTVRHESKRISKAVSAVCRVGEPKRINVVVRVSYNAPVFW